MKKTRYKHLYFAYGSNLNMAQMRVRCPLAQPLGTSELPGWEFCWNRFANIRPANSRAFVPGGLWAITDDCLAALDQYEGYPRMYDRFYVLVTNPKNSSKTTAPITYAMPETTPFRGDPALSYVHSIMEGYEDFGICDTVGLLEMANELKTDLRDPFGFYDDEDDAPDPGPEIYL